MEGLFVDELSFAIDGLYATGWWPADGDCCLLSTDGRWYPSESMIRGYFTQSLVPCKITDSSESASVEAQWKSLNRASQSVRGRTRQETLILAFTKLYVETSHTMIHE